MNILKTIGQNVSNRRKELSMTQEDLCGIAEIDRSYLSEIENGKMNVSILALEKIAKALESDIVSLIK